MSAPPVSGLLWLLTTSALSAELPRHWFYPPLASLESSHGDARRHLETLPPLPIPEAESCVGLFSGTSNPGASRWIQIDFESVCQIDSVTIVPAFAATQWGYGFPRAFRVELSITPDFGEPHPLHVSSASEPPQGPLFLEAGKTPARYLRITATELAPHPQAPSRGIFCLGEIFAFSGGRNVALRRPVTAPGSAESLPTWSPANVVDGSSALGLPVLPGEVPAGNGWHSAIHKTPDLSQWVQVDLGTPHPIEEVRLIPARPIDFMDRPGFGFPSRFKIEASDSADFAAPVLLWDSREDAHPGSNGMAVRPHAVVPARFVRVTATRLWQRQHDYVFALAELQVFSGSTNVALGKPVSALEQTLTANWRPEFLVDNRASTGALRDLESWLSSLAGRIHAEARIKALEHRISEARTLADRRIVWALSALCACLLTAAGAVIFLLRWRERHRLRTLREQIARDLHDDIGSSLGSIALMSELARPAPSSEALSEIHRLASDAAAAMRGILWMVRDTGRPDLARLMDALRSTAAHALAGIECEFVCDLPGAPPRIDLAIHRQVFLAFKEAVHNISRHAKATSVTIRVRLQERILHLHIQDNGRGFDPSDDHRGSGLANMHHRINSLGGQLVLQSAPDTGTLLLFTVPLAP